MRPVPDTLPAFVPETNFKIEVMQYDKKILFWNLGVYGRISYKTKNRANRKG